MNDDFLKAAPMGLFVLLMMALFVAGLVGLVR